MQMLEKQLTKLYAEKAAKFPHTRILQKSKPTAAFDSGLSGS